MANYRSVLLSKMTDTGLVRLLYLSYLEFLMFYSSKNSLAKYFYWLVTFGVIKILN